MDDILKLIEPTGRRDAAMEEIWAIKEALWAEVDHLPLKEAIAERGRRANATAIELGFGHLIVKSSGDESRREQS